MEVAPLFILCPGENASGLYSDIASPGGERGDSGVDLRFPEDISIPPTGSLDGRPFMVDLQVKARCSAADRHGTFVPFDLRPRSSINKTPLSLANSVGTIDAGYQGNLKIAVRNHSSSPFAVKRGEALFQLVCPSLAPARVAVVSEAHNAFAVATSRGAGGFGSTGGAGAGAGASAGAGAGAGANRDTQA